MWCSFSYWYHHDGETLSPVLNSFTHRYDGSGLQNPLHFSPQVLSVACSTDRHSCWPVFFRASPNQKRGSFNGTTESSTLKKIVVLITPSIN